jgi:transposase
MSKPKRTFTAEFKRDAIALAERGDRSVAQIERDLGLSAGCLRPWRADARRAAAAGTTTDALADQARALQRLRRENARLREEPLLSDPTHHWRMQPAPLERAKPDLIDNHHQLRVLP